MSSVPEKSKLIHDKRSFFMRSSSFEKLKCSAKYPFRLVGIKLSKASVIEIAETIILKSRLLSQRILLGLFIIIYKAVCAILSLLVRTSANPLSVVVVSDKQDKNTKLGFYERLQIKVEKLQHHKKRLDSLNNNIYGFPTQITTEKSKVQPITTTTTTTITTVQPISPTILTNSDNVKDKTLNSDNDFANCKAYAFRSEMKRLREFSTEKDIMLRKSGSGSFQFGSLYANKNLLDILWLYPLVYGSIFIMMFQLYFLGNVMNTTPITFGYMFLIGSLGVIALITFKVFFCEKFRNIKLASAKSKSKKFAITNDEKSQNTIIDGVRCKTTDESTSETTLKRQSRSRLKTNIDLSSKTLSKIKLL